MDDVLSEFIAKTSCEPGFARDLLNHHNGNLGLALKAYYRMKDIIVDKEEFDEFAVDSNTKGNKNLDNNTFINEDLSCINKELNLVSNKCSSEPSLSSQSSDVCDSSIISSPSKLTFNFPNDINFLDKKLSRGISRAADNVNLVLKARSEFAQDFKTSSRGSRLLNVDGFLETPDFTFTLPDISIHQEDFYEFLKKDLIEKSTLLSLESSKRLNWWSEICQNLYPLVTSGDGNCLLHAASLGMWGFHDRELTLRRAMYILLSNSPYTPLFYRRWRWQTHFQNSKTGLNFNESEWQAEWDNILKMASTEPRSKKYNSSFDINGGKKEPNEYEEKSYIYESLEEIHIFVLAHVLRRPIIIIADIMLKDIKGEAFFPIPFGGIYLPLECPDTCLMKSPLCLTYDAAHFSALVAMSKETLSESLPFAIPLMDVDHNILPLHFAIDPGEDIFSQKNEPIDIMFENMAKTFVLTEQDKIELLKKYFDILTFAHLKANCVEQDKQASSKIVEKSQTLPSNFGRKADFSEVQINEKEKSKTLSRKASAKLLLQKPFLSFGRMSKRIKKNIGHFARRSASFRLAKSPNLTSNTNSNTQSDPQSLISANVAQNSESNTLSNTATQSFYKESIINTDNSIFYCDTYVLAAKLYVDKHHLYYDDMIRNYLNTARVRFLNEKRDKKLNLMPSSSTLSTSSSTSSSSSSCSSLSTSSLKNSLDSASKSQIRCVNADCTSAASALTNYLCSACFEEQKRTLIERNYSSKVTKDLSTLSRIQPNKPQMQLDLSDDSDIKTVSSKLNENRTFPLYTHKTEVENSDKVKIYSDTFKDRMPREYFIPNSL